MTVLGLGRLTLVRFNGHGTGWKAPDPQRFRELRVYASGGRVEVWADLNPGRVEVEALQYLEPGQAVRVGLGFIRAAFVAVWQRR